MTDRISDERLEQLIAFAKMDGVQLWDDLTSALCECRTLRAERDALLEAIKGELYMFCTCDPAYNNKVLRDPTCGWCDQEGLRATIRAAQEKPQNK